MIVLFHNSKIFLLLFLDWNLITCFSDLILPNNNEIS